MLPRVPSTILLRREDLEGILQNLARAGFTLFGPVERDGVVQVAELDSVADLPAGRTDTRRPGHYRLGQNGAEWFGTSAPADSWKRLLLPPRLPLFSVRRNGDELVVDPEPDPPVRWAFIGIHPCDLKAISLHDRVFLGASEPDPHYAARRGELFLLAAQCAHPSESCFCLSLGSGPKAEAGFDLAVTELPDNLVIEVGSEAGSAMLEGVRWEAATAWDLGRAQRVHDQARASISRSLDTFDLPNMLFSNLDHPHWKELGRRCLACGNCTMVCPTCFCGDVGDEIEPSGQTTRRVRVWDSCYASSFSHVHGGNIRPTVTSRYRQWLTHKFASWKTQFGETGCVGCGRCMTFCPVGIDPTAELRALRGGGVR